MTISRIKLTYVGPRLSDSYQEERSIDVEGHEALIIECQQKLCHDRSLIRIEIHRQLPLRESLEAWEKIMVVKAEECIRINSHPVSLLCIDDRLVWIDMECLLFVQWLNQHHFPTRFCCQGNQLNPYHIIFELGMTMEDVDVLNHPDLKGIFKPWVNGLGERSVTYEAPNPLIAQRDYDLLKKSFKC